MGETVTIFINHIVPHRLNIRDIKIYKYGEDESMKSIRQFLIFVRPYTWHIIGTIIIGIFKFAIPLLIPLILKYVIDTIIQGDMTQAEKTSQLFWLMGISFTIFLILRPPIEYFRQYLAQLVGSKILYDLRDRLFDHIQRLSLKYYSNTKTGEIISRVIDR